MRRSNQAPHVVIPVVKRASLERWRVSRGSRVAVRSWELYMAR